MSEHTGLPVAGYRPQSSAAVELVNEHKILEEKLLRRLDVLAQERREPGEGEMESILYPTYSPRWLAIARSHFEQGFMAFNRAVFQPERISLPED